MHISKSKRVIVVTATHFLKCFGYNAVTSLVACKTGVPAVPQQSLLENYRKLGESRRFFEPWLPFCGRIGNGTGVHTEIGSTARGNPTIPVVCSPKHNMCQLEPVRFPRQRRHSPAYAREDDRVSEPKCSLYLVPEFAPQSMGKAPRQRGEPGVRGRQLNVN